MTETPRREMQEVSKDPKKELFAILQKQNLDEKHAASLQALMSGELKGSEALEKVTELIKEVKDNDYRMDVYQLYTELLGQW